MIRAGRTAIDDEGTALLCGYSSLRAAKRAGLFKAPGLPQPINARGNKKLRDKGQVLAYHRGEPLPEIPHVDADADLLDAIEAAALWHIDPATWAYYHRTKPHLIPTPIEVCGIPHWSRGDIETFRRPGKGEGAGRPVGARDARPRTQAGGERQERVAAMLQTAQAQGVDLDPLSVADELGISAVHARRLIRAARTEGTASQQ